MDEVGRGQWVVGSGSWYYYISIFLLYLFVFKYVYNRDTLLIVSLFITPAALLMKTLNPQPDPTGFITNYLNPMYWISYFALGIAIRKYDLMRFLCTKRIVLAAGGIAFLSGAFLYIYQIFTYFHIVSAVFELSMFVILLHISMRLVNFRASSALEAVGKRTFVIYLLHMQIVQMIDTKLPALLLLEISMPVLGIVLMMLLTDIGLKVCSRIPFGKMLCALIGLKE